MNADTTKTVIGEDVEITGNVKCESGIQLNGKLNGDLTCGGQATIGDTSAVKGNLSIETITILGQVNGKDLEIEPPLADVDVRHSRVPPGSQFLFSPLRWRRGRSRQATGLAQDKFDLVDDVGCLGGVGVVALVDGPVADVYEWV